MYVTIGSRTLFGPGVQIYAAAHPVNFKERASGVEFVKPLSLVDVWAGQSVVICPGVTTGEPAVIEAGSIVTKDIPSDVFAAGRYWQTANGISYS